MDNYTATELAYKNGYEQGKKDAVRHGRWIDAYCGKYANAKYICSCCGKRAHSDDWKWELSDFCPNCGAKMDGDNHAV